MGVVASRADDVCALVAWFVSSASAGYTLALFIDVLVVCAVVLVNGRTGCACGFIGASFTVLIAWCTVIVG